MVTYLGVRVEVETLHVYHPLKKFFVQFELIPTPVELALARRWCTQMLEILKVGMLDGLCDRNTPIRIEAKHLLQQVYCERGSMRDLVLPLDRLLFRQPFQVAQRVPIINECKILLGRVAEDFDDLVELFHVVLPLEECGLAHQLYEDAAD